MKIHKSIAFIILISVGLMFVIASESNGELVDIKNLKSPVPGEKTFDASSPGNAVGKRVEPDINFGKIPLYFTANKGQVNARAKFYAKASRYTLWLTKRGLVFDSTLRIGEKAKHTSYGERRLLEAMNENEGTFARDVSRFVFLGANKNPEMVPLQETQHKVNYFIGNDKSKWHCDVPTSQAVLYKSLYRNIDLKVYGLEKQIEYDWLVKPMGDPGNIKFQYKNVKGTRLDAEGNLLIETDFGELMHKKPVSYQYVGASPHAGPTGDSASGSSSNSRGARQRIAVDVQFKRIAENTYGFEVGAYDVSRELIIDPVVLAYSTYLGGGAHDYGCGIALDAAGYVYVTGYTDSVDYPTLNQYQPNQGSTDVFITKLDTTRSGASSLIYSTYLGGNGSDRAGGGDWGVGGIAVDIYGNAYVTGGTNSTDFPTLNQYQTYRGGGDIFVTKLDTTRRGAAGLLYSTYLGGSGGEGGGDIAVDAAGNAYVTGRTSSSNFPTLNQYQASHRGGGDIFVTKLDTTQSGTSSLIYSTYLGGGDEDRCRGIAADAAGNAYVTGYTYSTDFPVINEYQSEIWEEVYCDVFVTRLDTTRGGAAGLIYSTYLGRRGFDEGYDIAVDTDCNVYVAGMTESSDFPTLNPYQECPGFFHGFVTRLDTNQSGASSLTYSTCVVEGGENHCRAIALDSAGNVYVTGGLINNSGSIFVNKLDITQSGASGLLYSIHLWGDRSEAGTGIAVDAAGNAYVTGMTHSSDFPILNQYQTDQGGYDAFVIKLVFTDIPTVDTPSSSNISYTTAAAGGNVAAVNGANITERGVYRSTVGGFAPPDEGTKISETGNWGTGTFTVGLTGLPVGGTIYFRAFAANSEGAGYSQQDSFTTASYTIPTVTTTAVSAITATTASSGGNVTSDGGVTVTARGVCRSTSANPTTADAFTTDGTGTGVFSSLVTGLNPDTTYYLRAYAVNTVGTAYGNGVTFTTAGNPIIAGTVTDGSNPMEGVAVTFSHDQHTETTNADGHYSYTVAYGTTTTVTPAKTGYSSWNPSDETFTNIISNQTQNFSGALNTYIISGTVTNGTHPVQGVTISFSHDQHNETTDAGGNFSYTVVYGTSTTVTAAKQGYSFEPTFYDYTGLTEDKPDQNFSVLNFVSVAVTNPQNGDTVSGAVIIDAETSSQEANAAYDTGQAVTKVEFYIDEVLAKQDTRAPYQHRWDTALVSNGSFTIAAKAYHSSGLTCRDTVMVTVGNSNEPPHITLNRDGLHFGAVFGEPAGGAQQFLVANGGGGTLNWTASPSDTWIQVDPSSGTADTLVAVSVDVAGFEAGDYPGTITITDANADNSPVSVTIGLTVHTANVPPIGSIDSPPEGSAVAGSIPVTGWALDETGIAGVKIYRLPIPGEEAGTVYIGDAVFVEGARPDIETQYSQYPQNYRAGWGYMLLTKLLPNEGNGTFVLTAVATDGSGNEKTLGSKTIICDNANAVKPFGAIDTPGPGDEVSGTEYVNYGWALTPQPNTIPTDGSTISVWVDGVSLEGHPVYNLYREDIALAFPGYTNSGGAVGYYYLDTTLYGNGVHTMAWTVTDDAGNTEGIGSRYFKTLNAAVPFVASLAAFGKRDNVSIQNLPVGGTPVCLDKGYNTGMETKHFRKILYPDKEGIIHIGIKEDERIKMEVGVPPRGEEVPPRGEEFQCRGYMLVDGQLRGLPVGSTMDKRDGVFYWQPGPGFIGTYRFVFIGKDSNGEKSRRNITITISPKQETVSYNPVLSVRQAVREAA
ncbi:MAG: hypothetical protein GY765_26800, partial [bacterium]|nr:hypothetical protein [bacterium]